MPGKFPASSANYLRFTAFRAFPDHVKRATEQIMTVSDYCGRTLVTLMYWLPKLSISYCPFFLSKRILAAAMI